MNILPNYEAEKRIVDPPTPSPATMATQAAFFNFSSWEPEGLRATFLPNFPENLEKTILLFNI